MISFYDILGEGKGGGGGKAARLDLCDLNSEMIERIE